MSACNKREATIVTKTHQRSGPQQVPACLSREPERNGMKSRSSALISENVWRKTEVHWRCKQMQSRREGGW